MELKRWPSFLALTFMFSFRAFSFAQELSDEPSLEDPATGGAIVTDAPKDEDDKSTSGEPSPPTINLDDLLKLQGANPGPQPAAELPKYMIGVSLAEVPASLRAHIVLEDGQGIMIGVVVPDSPAAKAGLQQYDIILKSDNKPLKHPKELQVLVDAREEKPVSVTIFRRGELKTVEITPVTREAIQALCAQPPLGQVPQEVQFGDSVNPGRVLRFPDGRIVMLANPGSTPTAVAPPVNAEQIDSLTQSIQTMTQQLERLQQAIDRLEKKSEAPEVKPPGEKTGDTP